ncbi:unnamed protein product, partial [Heterotrigona itama]
RSLEFFDLLPEDPKLYDKMRPPKKDGQATVVYFHVTVMGLDSIDETSMIIGSRLVKEYVATGFVLQERQIGDLSDDDHTESLLMVVQRQDYSIYGQ